MTKSKRLQQRQEKPRANLARDLEILAEHLPAELGGQGKSVEDIAGEQGVSRWAIYKRLEREDVKEAERAWISYIVGSQRDLGPVAVKALGRLLEAGDSATVNAFFKRMGPPEPVAETNIEKLEIKIRVEDAKRLGFQPGESVDFAEYMKRSSEEFQREHLTPESSYHCPACSYTTEDISQLGEHLQAAHCQKPALEREAEIRSFRATLAAIDEEKQ